METINLTTEEKAQRRWTLFNETLKEYPHVPDLIATSSGILEPLPTTQEEWDNFRENLLYVR